MQKKSIQSIIRYLEQKAPSSTAESWDNVGLLVGDPHWETHGATVSVDLTSDVVDQAIERGDSLIVNHHPCIFRGLKKWLPRSPLALETQMFRALENKIAIASYHTNFDQCALEVATTVSSGLGVKPLGRLIDRPKAGTTTLTKIVVFLPRSHQSSVKTAMFEAGAGSVGAYDSCGFEIPGKGSFRGNEGSRPFIGKPQQLEEVEEIRFETIVPTRSLKSVIRAMMEAHPYEEVAYDLYPVSQEPSGKGLISGLGYGFWGEFNERKPFSEVAERVKSLFKIDGFFLTEPVPHTVQRIGFVAGKGASFIDAALSQRCDLFITGEADYHDVIRGARSGMAVMELGHRESEYFYIQIMGQWLEQLGLNVAMNHQPLQKMHGVK